MRAFDALSVPDTGQYATLRALGFEVACGYTRALTPTAVRTALGLGMAVLPLLEAGDSTNLAYFTPAQGDADGARFASWADQNGMPNGLPFVGVFLDFDCPVNAMDGVILPYVNELVNTVAQRNPLWLYGPRDCIDYAATRWPGIAGFFQAYAPAWSGGRNADPSPYADLVQVKNGLDIVGVPVDMSVVCTAAKMWRLA